MGQVKTCIINVAVDGWYPEGQDRLKKSLALVGYKGDTMFWKNKFPPGSDPHHMVPYGFKPAAFRAARAEGYTTIQWLDASFWAIKPMDRLFAEIESEGHYLAPEAFSVGSWCTDAALVTLGLEREEAFTIPLVIAGAIGLDLTNERSMKFLDEWSRLSKDGVTFLGPWRQDGLDTKDKRVHGHRHDLTAASVIAWRLGMKRSTSGLMTTNWQDPPDPVIMLARGGVNKDDLKRTVCV